MKRTVLIALTASWVIGCSAPNQVEGAAEAASGAVFRHHFAGLTDLTGDPKATKLQEVLGLAESAAYAQEIASKLATAPFRALKAHLPEGATDQADLLGPLVRDLFNDESSSEIREVAGSLELLLSLRLSEEQAVVWSTNLWQALSAWNRPPRPIQVGEFAGWEAKSADNVLQFFRAADWVIVGAGAGQLNLAPEALGRIKNGKPPLEQKESAFLTLDADLSRSPIGRALSLARADLSMALDGENLRTTGTIKVARPVPVPLEAWKVPTNSIPDSIVSFFAARGLAPFLESFEQMKQIDFTRPLNQVIGWGPNVKHSGYLLAVTPVSDPTNELRRLAPTVSKVLNDWLQPQMGKLAYASNAASISMIGLPYVLPHLKPMAGDGSDYLVFGMFPTPPSDTTPPEELLNQLGDRDDLLYYGWEITQNRLFHARQTYQLGDILRAKMFTPLSSPSQKWVTAVAPLLGNTVTELSRVSPTELALTRRSHLGLTGFEIFTLMRWMESEGFPLRWDPRAGRKELITPEKLKEAKERARQQGSPPPPPP